jgi:hypothetical protein
MSKLVWFQLVDGNGQPYKQTTCAAVSLSPNTVVDQFRDAVKAKYDQPDYLKYIPSSTLVVYKNRASFDKRNVDEGKEALRSSYLVDGLGESEEEALVVVVPSVADIKKENYIEIAAQDPRKAFKLLLINSRAFRLLL